MVLFRFCRLACRSLPYCLLPIRHSPMHGVWPRVLTAAHNSLSASTDVATRLCYTVLLSCKPFSGEMVPVPNRCQETLYWNRLCHGTPRSARSDGHAANTLGVSVHWRSAVAPSDWLARPIKTISKRT